MVLFPRSISLLTKEGIATYPGGLVYENMLHHAREGGRDRMQEYIVYITMQNMVALSFPVCCKNCFFLGMAL